MAHVRTVGSLLHQQACKMCFTHRIYCEESLYTSKRWWSYRLRLDQTLWLPQLRKLKHLLCHSEAVDFRFLYIYQYCFARENTPTYVVMALLTLTRPEHITKSFKDHDPELHPSADIQCADCLVCFTSWQRGKQATYCNVA